MVLALAVSATACSSAHHGPVHHPAPPVEIIVEAGPEFPALHGVHGEEVDIEAEIRQEQAEADAERLDRSTARLTAILGAGVVGAVLGGLAGLSKDCDGQDLLTCRRKKSDAVDAVTGSVMGASIGALIGWGLYEIAEDE